MMNGKFTLFKAMEIVTTILLLSLCLFGDSRVSEIYPIGSIAHELTAAFRDPETQGVVFLCVSVNFLIFLLLEFRISRLSFWCWTNSSLWLAGLLLFGGILYSFNYFAAAQSTRALMLVTGAALGAGARLWSDFKNKKWPPKTEINAELHSGSSLDVLIMPLLVILLAVALLGHTMEANVEYRSYLRWSGPWNSPNDYGLFMGIGSILAIGLLAAQSLKFKIQERNGRSWNSEVKRYAVIVVCFLAVILMVRSLLHSYSRGAWLATICGLGYLTSSRIFSIQYSVFSHWLRKNAFLVAIIMLSLCISAFWQFRDEEWHPARRAFSAGNINDFSWRNRVSAWEGALQIIAEHPWFGAGWNQPEPLYEHFYLSPKLNESAAIGLNDYLVLGATLGIPALLCFGAYLWLSLTRSGSRVPPLAGIGTRLREHGTLSEVGDQPSRSNFELLTSDFPPLVCRATAIVLLAGFWFDGGLFELPTAATFWIFLHLAAGINHNQG
jgi:hypothetical protein